MTAILRERTTFPAPGSPDSPITVAAQYGNFIAGAFVGPVDGKYRETANHRMMLDHYTLTKCLLVSYDP